jgi:hypothetical protein
MFNRFSLKLTRLASIALLLINQLAPLSALVTPAPVYAQNEINPVLPKSHSSVLAKFDQPTNNFEIIVSPAQEINYTLIYTHDQGIQEALGGHQVAENNIAFTKAFAGTCSGTDCTKHQNIRDVSLNLEILVNNRWESKNVTIIVQNNKTWTRDEDIKYIHNERPILIS